MKKLARQHRRRDSADLGRKRLRRLIEHLFPIPPSLYLSNENESNWHLFGDALHQPQMCLALKRFFVTDDGLL